MPPTASASSIIWRNRTPRSCRPRPPPGACCSTRNGPGNPRLKMLCGGEALPRDLANQLLAKGGELWNMYGPTETTIWSSVARIESDALITIGQPIANTQLHILDPKLQPVPLGVPGELHIGGLGLARGYRNRPELTAEKFIPDPFSSMPGARLYKTGDVARTRAGGQIEVLGRLDHQVKIRGYPHRAGRDRGASGRISGHQGNRRRGARSRARTQAARRLFRPPSRGRRVAERAGSRRRPDDLLVSAAALAGALGGEAPDLVLFGQQSSDGEGACLWAAVAEHLGLPCHLSGRRAHPRGATR